MAIARVAGQATGDKAANATSISKAFPGNVTAGNLLVIAIARWSGSSDAVVVGDISKSAGTATLGSFTLDGILQYNYSGSNYLNVAIFSVPVTGSGSCTIQVAGAPSGSYWIIGLQEYSGASTAADRVRTTAQGSNSTGAPATAGFNSTNGDVIFAALGTGTIASTTHTVSTDYTQIYEQEADTDMTGAFADRITTDDLTGETADWTAPTTVPFDIIAAVYKVASGGGGTAVPVFVNNLRQQRIL